MQLHNVFHAHWNDIVTFQCVKGKYYQVYLFAIVSCVYNKVEAVEASNFVSGHLCTSTWTLVVLFT